MKKYVMSAMLFASIAATAQENMKTVSGCVTDAASGKPIAGVIVEAYGDARYTAMTDEKGHYEFKVPVYTSSVGMKVDGYNYQQTAISDGKADGRLYVSTFTAGYSPETKAAVTVTASGFDNTSEVSIDPLIQQRLGAHVCSVSRGGNVGLGNIMTIAGLNSLQINAYPLIVIDDVIMDMQYDKAMLHDGYFNNILSNINVNDIESVNVVKNGTALYGAKGANGVIVIKTKRSKSMATKIDVTVNGSYELTPRLPNMLDAEGYRLYATQLLSKMTSHVGSYDFLNSDPNYYYYKKYHNQTDWADLVYDNAFSQNYGINVQGGDNVATYNLSVGYSIGNSTLENNDYKRFNMRLNSDIEVFKNFNVRFDAFYSDVDRNLRDDGAIVNPLDNIVTAPGFLGLAKAPFLSPYAYDKKGNLSHYLSEADDYIGGDNSLANPLSILKHGEGKNRNTFGNRLIMFSVMPKFRINNHLSLMEHFTLSLVNTNENYYLPMQGVPTFSKDEYDENAALHNIAQSLASRQTGIQSDTRVNWNNRYGAHTVSVSGGMRFLSSEYKLTKQSGFDTGNDKTPQMSNSLRFQRTGGVDNSVREITWYGLADYSFAGKYYLSAGLSAQTSSRFGEDAGNLRLFDVPWGLFPSVEASWVMTNEKWMAGLSGINYLKLNVGFDVTGNDDIDYTASKTYFVANTMLGTSSAPSADGISIGNIGNTELQWETTRRFTAGFDGSFIDNRLNVRFNVFKSWTSNLLTLHSLAWTSGLTKNWSNDGKLENSGFDVSVNVKALNLKDFKWEIGASVGHYKNEITSLPDNNKPFETDIYGATVLTKVGEPVGVFYGWKTNGVYATTADADADGKYIVKGNGNREYFKGGDMCFVDRDNNGVIDDNDRFVIGDPNPDAYGNIFTTFTWKNLTLNAVFNYSLGNDIFNYQRSLLEGGSYFLNQTTATANRWTTEGQVTDIPRVRYKDPLGNSRFSDRWIEDGSYLKLASVTLSYYLPVQSEYLQGITIWGNASNLFTITRYLGGDPDCGMTGGVLTHGIDRGLLSAGRTFSLGVNINL